VPLTMPLASKTLIADRVGQEKKFEMLLKIATGDLMAAGS